jgi:hypothetical protein
LKLLYTDTDSMYYEIRWPDDPVDYLAGSAKKGVFDFSLVADYKDTPQKGKLGCFKYEAGDNKDGIKDKDNEIVEAVFLAPKSYAKRMRLLKKGKELVIAGKGVPGSVLQEKFGSSIDHFKDVVLCNKSQKASFNTLQSKRHIVNHCEVTKVALSGENDKVFQVSPYKSRPLGHKDNTQPVDACPDWDIVDDYDEVLAKARKLIADNTAPLIVPEESEEEDADDDYSESECSDCDGED